MEYPICQKLFRQKISISILKIRNSICKDTEVQRSSAVLRTANNLISQCKIHRKKNLKRLIRTG